MGADRSFPHNLLSVFLSSKPVPCSFIFLQSLQSFVVVLGAQLGTVVSLPLSGVICYYMPSVFPSIRVFSKELVLHIRWPKYWSFSISPSSEYSVLISFTIAWFDLLEVQGTLKSSPTLQFKNTNSSALRFLYGPTCTSMTVSYKKERVKQ